MVKLKQGDIIKLDFDPQTGYEQKGRRPAIVISNSRFNRYSKMIMVCPITHTDKNHPFHVRLGGNTKTAGVILCDQLKTLDIVARSYEFIEKATSETIFNVLDIIMNFFETEE
ncbi:MAG: type II toxin-antitoxin system PemK/MazF family toxin [Clostridiales bacterium]|jgi:mRNA interferase MazF|nr:type II toxin-antitoxin system PemK/MazF family toxin [Clostridiales bacterium]